MNIKLAAWLKSELGSMIFLQLRILCQLDTIVGTLAIRFMALL